MTFCYLYSPQLPMVLEYYNVEVPELEKHVDRLMKAEGDFWKESFYDETDTAWYVDWTRVCSFVITRDDPTNSPKAPGYGLPLVTSGLAESDD